MIVVHSLPPPELPQSGASHRRPLRNALLRPMMHPARSTKRPSRKLPLNMRRHRQMTALEACLGIYKMKTQAWRAADDQ